jgi:hypothetical protein
MPSKPRKPRHWICSHPRCPKGVTVYVNLPEPPVHLCDPRGGRIYALELENGEQPK